jgi:hypothetical protein
MTVNIPYEEWMVINHPTCFKLKNGKYVFNGATCYFRQNWDEMKHFWVEKERVDAARKLLEAA